MKSVNTIKPSFVNRKTSTTNLSVVDFFQIVKEQPLIKNQMSASMLTSDLYTSGLE